MNALKNGLLGSLAMLALLPGTARASEPQASDADVTLPQAKTPPDTISPAFARVWSSLIAKPSPPATLLPPDDVAGWKRLQAETERDLASVSAMMPKMLGVTVIDRTIAGVPVVEITPKDWQDDGRLLLYTHGGGFTSLSAHSTLFSSGLMARESGMRVLAIDYTLAPEAKWREVMDQVTSVYRAVLANGMNAENIGIYGDSAGGSIAAGMVLKLRDDDVPMPGALLLWSPWSDVSMTGDTYRTLADWDPLLTVPGLTASAAAYAAPEDQKNPYVSPIYGDYSKGSPPTLIQCGTREMFLSNCVRHYRAIRDAGGKATLDLYEGMPHVFQAMGAGTPEWAAAMAEAKRFWDTHLSGS